MDRQRLVNCWPTVVWCRSIHSRHPVGWRSLELVLLLRLACHSPLQSKPFASIARLSSAVISDGNTDGHAARLQPLSGGSELTAPRIGVATHRFVVPALVIAGLMSGLTLFNDLIVPPANRAYVTMYKSIGRSIDSDRSISFIPVMAISLTALLRKRAPNPAFLCKRIHRRGDGERHPPRHESLWQKTSLKCQNSYL